MVLQWSNQWEEEEEEEEEVNLIKQHQYESIR
jgi:hypothetical protein